MASPMPFQPAGGWSNTGQAVPPSNDQEDAGVQTRSVGLKVLYKFNKDDKFDCLARPPQTINVQTIPIDDKTTIGVVDLRICIQAVIDCSPELPGCDCDFTIYAHDYSEPDTPLVGQGMLSTALSSLHQDMGSHAKMITGLVAKNKLGLLMGSANKETLEVKLKFTETARSQPQVPQPMQQQSQQAYSQPRPHSRTHSQSQFLHHTPQNQQHPQPQLQTDVHHPRPRDGAMTPTGAMEWQSFMQSNPQIGQPASFSRVASPALSQGPPQLAHERRNSFAQVLQPQLQPLMPQEPQRVAPIPIEPPSDAAIPGPSSRPSSRASNKGPPRKRPTGRPRGRPRKKPVEGHTSGYEDGTEGEDGPAKKRAKIMAVDKAGSNPFGTEPESLRVAASTSGSLRSFRPIGMSQEASVGNHLQEIPRAPTPITLAPKLKRGPPKGTPKVSGRAQSSLNRTTSNLSTRTSPQPPRLRALSPSQEDGRSPDSIVQTPAYSDDSPADIGSSPPVPRTTSFIMQSSPPPSSPMLPPMPQPQQSQDDALENDELGDLFGEERAAPVVIEKVLEAPTRKGNRIGPRRPSSAIPMQVFRMEDGPNGQDMVHLRSWNTPDPTSMPAMPPSDQPSKAPVSLPQDLSMQYPQASAGGLNSAPPNNFAAPTPPQTTDAVEKPTSPPVPDDLSQKPTTDVATPQQLPQEPTAQEPFFAPLPQPSVEAAEGQNMDASASATASGSGVEPVVNAAQATHQVKAVDNQPAASKQKNGKVQPRSRKLARSQSAGALTLPMVPASEPIGPSTLSQSMTAEAPQPPIADPPSTLRRATSTGPLSLPVPASDPVGPPAVSQQPSLLTLPEPICPPSDALPPAPSSPQEGRSNKNVVKKNAIKQKLEAAITKGEMPPFCSNCGAIETPTWRRMYVQELEGVPPEYEFSTKPGMITTVDILTRDDQNTPTSYRLVKKTLGSEEEKHEWQELVLCNPCGIWLGKCYSHRPRNRWDSDAARLGRERKKRTSEAAPKPRAKKPRTKSTTQTNPASEAGIPTDGPTSFETSQPETMESAATNVDGPANDDISGNRTADHKLDNAEPQSTHSSGSGTAKSPIDLELEAAMGSTKRLLFPSPRKDNTPKILSEVSVNIVHTEIDCHERKENIVEKENVAIPEGLVAPEGDDLEDLFRSPMPPRPSTPISKGKAGPPTTPFKTPTRATPSHRPVTRSVSRSMRSKESLASPVADFEKTPSRTPSRTPRGNDFSYLGSGSKRRSPRNNHAIDFNSSFFDTPVSRAVNQMLSEPNFGLDDEMELVTLGGAADTDPNWAQFSSFFSTDAPMPSSPPKDRMIFGSDQLVDMWDWSVDASLEPPKER